MLAHSMMEIENFKSLALSSALGPIMPVTPLRVKCHSRASTWPDRLNLTSRASSRRTSFVRLVLPTLDSIAVTPSSTSTRRVSPATWKLCSMRLSGRAAAMASLAALPTSLFLLTCETVLLATAAAPFLQVLLMPLPRARRGCAAGRGEVTGPRT